MHRHHCYDIFVSNVCFHFRSCRRRSTFETEAEYRDFIRTKYGLDIGLYLRELDENKQELQRDEADRERAKKNISNSKRRLKCIFNETTRRLQKLLSRKTRQQEKAAKSHGNGVQFLPFVVQTM